MNGTDLNLNAYYVPGILLALELYYANRTWHMLSGNLQFGGIDGNINKLFQYNRVSTFFFLK